MRQAAGGVQGVRSVQIFDSMVFGAKEQLVPQRLIP